MKHIKSNIEPLRLAITIAGSQKELAEAIGLNVNQLCNCMNGRGKIPAKYCRAIEELTNGDVTAEELRPDVFLLPSQQQLTA
jgi:DNA-binding transcriptional regulator YdaS (Cro superfamily)